jgi:hypothetical protein
LDAEESALDDEPSLQPAVDASDVRLVVEEIQAKDKRSRWQMDVTLPLQNQPWRPSAVTTSGKAVLYVCLTGVIPRYVVSRMVEAFSLGLQIRVALPLETLYASRVLEVMAAIDASVYVVQGTQTNDVTPRHFMAAMADLDVPVQPTTRVKIGKEVFGRVRSGTDQEKGRRFEALLAFLFSQVSDFRVVERNLRTKTQEIDIVLQIHSHSQRSWQQQVPYLLVEAKNTADLTPQGVVSTLITKVRTKGQSCKMAFLVSFAGFTSDALNEELRYSESENRIIMIGPKELEALLDATDLDGLLDQMVRRGRMR